ncbi:MAG TPA: PIG-L family deacetylase [Gemmatimonadota bacterium]|nr:PIG-L family deacetylase [Gemmatimonadota bacterium]
MVPPGQAIDARLVDPAERFRGTVAVLAPHMDDELLACGGTLAALPSKARVHVVWATDGSRSPAPAAPWKSPPAGLAETRAREAGEALATLGVPAENLHFLGLPDGRLRGHAAELDQALGPLLTAIGPTRILAPFRYDRHPDHLAVQRAAVTWMAGRDDRPELIEYFVYTGSRLLPRGDIRSYIRPGLLVGVDIGRWSGAKRRALERYRSQTTRAYDFQHRPNLTPALLDQVCREAELFLPYSPSMPGPAVFAGPVAYIRLVHWLEPHLKAGKDRLAGLLRQPGS